MSNITIIIPAFNEEQSIGKVIQDLKEIEEQIPYYKFFIIICNNGSTDSTAQVSKEHGAFVVDEPIKGYGQACLSGLKHIPTNSHVIVFIDGDYSDDPKEISHLIEPVIKEDYDIVLGSRILGKKKRYYEEGALLPQAIFGNWLSTNLIYLLWKFKYTDLGPFRAIEYSKLKQLQMDDKNFGWTIQMQIRAIKHKFNIKEIPVSYKKRIGQSKISGTIKGSFWAGVIILRTIFKEAFYKK